jgi:hypothetical protein
VSRSEEYTPPYSVEWGPRPTWTPASRDTLGLSAPAKGRSMRRTRHFSTSAIAGWSPRSGPARSSRGIHLDTSSRPTSWTRPTVPGTFPRTGSTSTSSGRRPRALGPGSGWFRTRSPTAARPADAATGSFPLPRPFPRWAVCSLEGGFCSPGWPSVPAPVARSAAAGGALTRPFTRAEHPRPRARPSSGPSPASSSPRGATRRPPPERETRSRRATIPQRFSVS